MTQILASGKIGSQKYVDNDATRPVPALDFQLTSQQYKTAYQQTKGYCESTNAGNEDAINDKLSIIEESNLTDYNSEFSKLIQTYVANNSYLDVDATSTANNIFLIPRIIADIDSPDGTNYSEETSLPFAFRENLKFVFRATLTNTSATTISISLLSGLTGSIDVIDETGSALSGGEIIAGKFYEIVCTTVSSVNKFILVNKSKQNTIYSPITKTIVSGAITVNSTDSLILLNGEGGVADNLDTINGGTNGQVLTIKNINSYTITLRDNGISSSNLWFLYNTNRILDYSVDTVELVYLDEAWQEKNSKTNYDFYSNLNSSAGFQYLPNGLILQWGEETNYHDVVATWTSSTAFPITFPKTCLQVICGIKSSSSPGISINCIATNLTNSNFTLMMNEWTATFNNVKGTFLAIGY